MSPSPERTADREPSNSDKVPSRLEALPFAAAAATIAAVFMFLLGVFGAIGIYEGAVEMMEQWHMFFTPTLVGTVAGILEAVIITGVFTYLFVKLYNGFTGRIS